MEVNKVFEIFDGFKNLIFNNEEELAEYRKSICDKCPLNNNGICSTKREVNGIKGCGCVLKAKQRSPKSHCPRQLW